MICEVGYLTTLKQRSYNFELVSKRLNFYVVFISPLSNDFVLSRLNTFFFLNLSDVVFHCASFGTTLIAGSWFLPPLNPFWNCMLSPYFDYTVHHYCFKSTWHIIDVFWVGQMVTFIYQVDLTLFLCSNVKIAEPILIREY